MSKKSKIKPEDLDTFHKAVKGTSVLLQKKIRLSPSFSPISSPKKNLPEIDLSTKAVQAPPPVDPEAFLTYKQVSVSNKILRKLRKGQYNVDAILDLHGMTVEAAKESVYNFLQQCSDKGIQVALIIHGKSRYRSLPTLKNKLNHWLREIDIVLAFCSAAPSHGSRGAVYILLKREKL